MTPTLILVGPLGAGRTSVGREVARLANVSLTETEELVSARLGMEFDQAVLGADPEGLSAAIESAALEQLTTAGVVSLLPGASTKAVHQALGNSQAPLVYLTASINELARRLGLNAPRGTNLGTPRTMFVQMVRELEVSYQVLAPEVINTEGRGAHTVAIEIAERFALQ